MKPIPNFKFKGPFGTQEKFLMKRKRDMERKRKRKREKRKKKLFDMK